ncbi:hypothetical protein F2Q69_00019932 [Brassica cretica]|uniref:Uncharacterized protein n=1 Tax=Brassica cretica TaxID=69181 RepID=A0A8S9QUF0_BRACR|nr:hypothetical protein F2Q69_00019932 [Brassica cretica]
MTPTPNYPQRPFLFFFKRERKKERKKERERESERERERERERKKRKGDSSPELVAGATVCRDHVQLVTPDQHPRPSSCSSRRDEAVAADRAAIGARISPHAPLEVSPLRAREVHAPPPSPPVTDTCDSPATRPSQLKTDCCMPDCMRLWPTLVDRLSCSLERAASVHLARTIVCCLSTLGGDLKGRARISIRGFGGFATITLGMSAYDLNSGTNPLKKERKKERERGRRGREKAHLSSSPEQPCAVITFSSSPPINTLDEAVAADRAAIGARMSPYAPQEVSPLRAREVHAPPPSPPVTDTGDSPATWSTRPSQLSESTRLTRLTDRRSDSKFRSDFRFGVHLRSWSSYIPLLIIAKLGLFLFGDGYRNGLLYAGLYEVMANFSQPVEL